MHSTSDKIGGEADITTAIAVAQLALKHRQNKNLRQRIIVFVGSPLAGQAADEPSMVKLAKKLKKNNVAVDFVAFGDGIEEGPLNVLRTFSETASSADNSCVMKLTLDADNILTPSLDITLPYNPVSCCYLTFYCHRLC